MHDTASVISNFVNVLNRQGLEPLFGQDVPLELRKAELAEISDMFEWEIQPAEINGWVSPLETLLPCKFPDLYHVLISRYRFAEFEVGPVMFFANTGKEVSHELSQRVFVDKGLYPTLLKHGLLQFGKQAGGGYDPVCFAMSRRQRDDAPIVQVDHEDVLIHGRVHVVAEIAPSFRAFVERVIDGEIKKR